MIRRIKQKGFTLIELMIVVAIIGILAAIAIPAFIEYMNKSKTTEAELNLNQLEKKVKTYNIEKGLIPGNGAELPAAWGGRCGANVDKLAKVPQSSWVGGWAQMGFHIDEDSLYSYSWATAAANAGGTGTASYDGNCDGTAGTFVLTLMKDADANLTAVYTNTPD